MRESEEIPLTGGNVTEGLVRVGDTVRRPAGAWTPAVDALLGHLHEVGFTGAPRPLGRDERGRQVLSFAPGACPYPEDAAGLLASDAGLRRAARLVREFHDAVSGFVPPVDARWNRLYPAEQTGDEIIAHQDLAPWNLVVDPGSDPDAGAGWMFIDWDGAAPGTRLWDVAYAIKGFAPLWHGWNGKLELGEEARRIRLFADAYGLDEPERRELVPLLGQRALAMHTLLRDGAARAEQPWARLWEEGHGTHWREAAEHLTNHQEHRLHALLA